MPHQSAPAAPHPAWGPTVVLCGPMGSGKSSVGRALARRWQLTFRDTDEDVEAATGRTVAEVFADGEDRFRQVERQAVARALETHDGILALGGGAVLHPATRRALDRYAAGGGIVVSLEVSEPVALQRVTRGTTTRPLLADDPDRWKQVADARRPVYEQVATLHVATDGITPDEVAADIERLLQVARTASFGIPVVAVRAEPGDAPGGTV
ncbi:MAG: shikimate kinase [Micrococcales bacterium]|nr:shikimate kinase [Micrococcales bacterium]